MSTWIDRSYRMDDFTNSYRKVISESITPKQKEIKVTEESEFTRLFEAVDHSNLIEAAVTDKLKKVASGTLKNTFNKNARAKNAINKKALVHFGIEEDKISENIFGKEKVFTVSGDWDISGREELDLSSLHGIKISVKGKFDCSETAIESFSQFPTITCADFIFKNGKSELKDLVGCPVARRNVELDGTKLKSIVGLQLTNATSPEKLTGNLILANTGITSTSIKRNENYKTNPSWSLKVGGILDLTNCFPIENINWFIDVIGKGIVPNSVRYNLDDIIYDRLSTENKVKFDKVVPVRIEEAISYTDFAAHLKAIRHFYKLALTSPSEKPTEAPTSEPTTQVSNTTSKPVKPAVEPANKVSEPIKPNADLNFDVNKLKPLDRSNFARALNGLVTLYNPDSKKNYFNTINALKKYAGMIGSPELSSEVDKILDVLGKEHIEPAVEIVKNILSKITSTKKETTNTDNSTEEALKELDNTNA